MARSSSHRLKKLFVPFALAVVASAMVAPAALGAPASAVATLTSPVRSGTTSSYTFTLTPNGAQMIRSFNLTAASGWSVVSIQSPATGVALATGSTTVIQGRGLAITSESPLTVAFTAQAPCFSSNTTWTLAARTGGNFTGSSVSVNQPSTKLEGTCSAAFLTSPTDAAFNEDTDGPSENITSARFFPTGPPIQVLVEDAGVTPSPRPGISVTLELTSGPGGDLSGPVTAVSDARGIATFQGSATNPIAIDEIGRGYVITPTAAGVSSTPSAPFGIYQEGTPCTSGPTCSVSGRGNVDGIVADITAPTGAKAALGAYVSADESLMCNGFTALSEEVVVWLYTGEGSQTIEVFLPKSVIRRVLDRGSDHLEFCFEPDPGKSFTDKFGVLRTTPGLLSDCNAGIDPDNCIVSETAVAGGGRLVTVQVKDGRGKL